MTLQLLSNALFTKTQQRVLGLLYGAPKKRFYTNEIVRIAAVGRGTVTRELVKLAQAQVLMISAEGNQKYYQANPHCPVYAELVKIAAKLFEVEVPKSERKVKKKPQQQQPSKRGKVSFKAAQKPAEKPRAVVNREHQQSQPIDEKDTSESDDEASVNITVDGEGQLGFF